MALRWIFVWRSIWGLDVLYWQTTQLGTIPSYVYCLDGYFGVGKGHHRNPPPGTHGDPRIQCTLATRGLEEPFSSCAVVSVFSSGGK
jgi:hypothetical protein